MAKFKTSLLFQFKNWYNKLVSDLMSLLNYTGIVENAALCSVQGQENSEYKALDRTQHIFWAMEIRPILIREYRTFKSMI